MKEIETENAREAQGNVQWALDFYRKTGEAVRITVKHPQGQSRLTIGAPRGRDTDEAKSTPRDERDYSHIDFGDGQPANAGYYHR